MWCNKEDKEDMILTIMMFMIQYYQSRQCDSYNNDEKIEDNDTAV